MNLIKRYNRKKDKLYYSTDEGRNKGQRKSTGIFIYTNPANVDQHQHNILAETQLKHYKKTKYKIDFIQYYHQYIILNKRPNNRHLECSLNQFLNFINKNNIPFAEISENLCKRFRRYLLDKYTGETPGNYYTRFKTVISAATSDGYLKSNPTEKLKSKRKPSIKLKQHLEEYEYRSLLKTSSPDQHIRNGFLFSCYTGLRWVDLKQLKWHQYNNKTLILNIIQAKTGHPVNINLHQIAQKILEQQPKGQPNTPIFKLPTADKANRLLKIWVQDAGINKHITWSCARLSFSIILQDNNVPLADVAYLMGHSSTEHVHKTYKRHRPKDQKEALAKLPTEEINLFQ